MALNRPSLSLLQKHTTERVLAFAAAVSVFRVDCAATLRSAA